MAKQKRDKKQAINQFAIYEVEFMKTQQTDAFLQDVDRDEAIQHAPEHFANLFSHEHLSLGKPIRLDDNTEKKSDYENDILGIYENVYLVRVHNNQKHKIVKKDGTTTNGHANYDEIIEWSRPYCYVVVDNRETPCLIAIQKNSAFGDPNAVRRIMQDGLNRMMRFDEKQPIDVKIYAKTRESEMWEFCRARCKDHEDVIKRIAFDFPNLKDYYKDDKAPNLPPILEETSKVMELTDALKMHMNLDYENADPEKLEKQTQNLAQIVRYCGRNTQYKLCIKFREYGEYRCDDTVKAIFPMKMQTLSDFIEGFMDIPYEKNLMGVMTWCDEIREKIKEYQNAVQIPAKRSRPRKK